MRKILLIIMINLLGGVILGENLLPGLQSATNMPRSGDAVKKVEVAPFKNQKRGVGQIWDFSQLPVLDKSGEVRYRILNDSTLIANENYENQTYALQNDSLLLSRQGTPGKNITYWLKELTMKYPLCMGDSIGGYFYGDGSLDDFNYLRNAGYSSCKISGLGIMITPEKDTLQNVIRCDYVRKATTFILPHFRQSFATSKDMALLSTDSITHWIANDSITHKIERSSWYAPGYRYPIVENSKYTIFYYSHPIDSVKIAYYTSPQSQVSELGNDPENEEIRYAIASGEYNNRYLSNHSNSTRSRSQNVADSGSTESSGVASRFSQDNSIQCVIYPQLIDQSTTVTFTGGDITSASIAVYNTAGALMWHNESEIDNSNSTYTCNLSTLAPGEYLLIAKSGNYTFPFKIIKQ